MPYKDPKRRREYDKAYKCKQRAEGLKKKGIDKRLTTVDIKTDEDLRALFNEIIAEIHNADNSMLDLEPRLRIKLRAVEIGLRVIEITDHEQRIAALEGGSHGPTYIKD